MVLGKMAPVPPTQPVQLYVSNFSEGISEGKMRQLFHRFTITKVIFRKREDGKQYCFITVPADTAETIVKEMNGTNVEGMPLQVQKSKSYRQLMENSNQNGVAIEVVASNQASNTKSKQVPNFHGMPPLELIDAFPDPPPSALFSTEEIDSSLHYRLTVTNFPPGIPEADLINLFGTFRPDACRIMINAPLAGLPTYAHVYFRDAAMGERAQKHTDGRVVKGSKILVTPTVRNAKAGSNGTV